MIWLCSHSTQPTIYFSFENISSLKLQTSLYFFYSSQTTRSKQGHLKYRWFRNLEMPLSFRSVYQLSYDWWYFGPTEMISLIFYCRVSISPLDGSVNSRRLKMVHIIQWESCYGKITKTEDVRYTPQHQSQVYFPKSLHQKGMVSYSSPLKPRHIYPMGDLSF